MPLSDEKRAAIRALMDKYGVPSGITDEAHAEAARRAAASGGSGGGLRRTRGWGVDAPGRAAVVSCRGRFRVYYWPKPTGKPRGFEVNWGRGTVSLTLRKGGRS